MKELSDTILMKRVKRLTGVFVCALLLITAGRSVSAATLYVAKTGSDSNPGTQSQPFLTINKAAQSAYAGDTVIVGEGEYRECVQPLRGGTSDTNRITYQAAPGANAVIKGSERITSWVRHSGNTWKATLSNSFFGGYNPYTAGHGKDTYDYFPVYNCGDVYLNGEAYYQKGTLAEVTANGNTWYSQVDSSNTTIYANFGGADPNTAVAEINVRKQCFVPSTWGLGYITVKGFTVMHSANMYSDFPGYPVHAQAGAISVYGGLKWIIENNTVINARSIGIDIGLGCDEWAGNRPGSARTHYYDTDRYGQHIVRNNLIQKCGQGGIAGVFSWKSQVLYNTIEGTNYRNEFCAAETGGIKLHYCNDGLIEGNYVKDTVGPFTAGIWTDWGNQGIRVSKNILVNNVLGYYAEAVVGPILVDNNVFVNNQSTRMLDSAGLVFVHNLFYKSTMNFDGAGRDCYVFAPHTMNASNVYSSPKYFNILNNIFIDCPIPAPPGTNNRVNFNSTGVSGFTYKATASSFTCSFNADGSPFTSHPLITDAYIGNIQPASQGIGVAVDKDYFGSSINTGSPVAGPFASLKNGSNSYSLWPRSGITPPTPPPSPVNLALDKTVTASSVSDNNLAAYAVDGSSGSRWASAFSDNQWIYVDLGSTMNLSSVKLSWEAAYARSYKIQVSNDAANWNDVYSTTTGDGGADQINFNASARYVRMLGIQRATTYGFSLWEFEVYGGSGSTTANEALNKPVTVSGTADNCLGANAVDGNASTRWSSAYNDNQWIYVDLGAVKNLTGVKLSWESAYGKAYKIQVSNDASGWDDVYSTANGDGGIDQISFTASGRYVRLLGIQRATAYGYSLWEFEVYGGGSAANDVSVGGTASDNGAANPSGEEEAKAFDKSSATKWLVYSPAGIIQYDFAGTSAYKVTQYSITSANDEAGRDPRNWQLQGSNDGTNWTTLDTRTGIAFSARLQTNTYTIANNTAYQIYRLNVTGNNGAAMLQLAELQLFGN